MSNELDNRLEKRIRFIVNHYSEGALDTQKAWERFTSEQKISVVFPLRRYLYRVAAVLLVLISIGTFYIWNKTTPEWVVIATHSGQVKEVYLPDNSIVSLAGNSQIRYDRRKYGKEQRTIEMKGKAFFRVHQDEASPFSVQTQYTETVVLGTSFQIEEKNLKTEIYVSTGKVQFIAGKEMKALVLTKGMSALYVEKTDELSSSVTENINYLSWKTKQLCFKNTPLIQVINDLSNYYQVSVINTKNDAQEIELTATFDNMPLEEVLLIINETLDVHLTVNKTK